MLALRPSSGGIQPAGLERVTGVPTDELLDALEEAVQARLIQEDGIGRYRFTHALVQETLLDELEGHGERGCTDGSGKR